MAGDSLVKRNGSDRGFVAKVQQARRAIAGCRDVRRVKQVGDVMAAAVEYARRAGYQLEIVNDAAEVKLEAERRCGELLVATVRRGNPQLLPNGTIGRLPEGINRKQSHFYQLAAGVPDGVFRAYCESCRQGGVEITTAGLLQAARVAGIAIPGILAGLGSRPLQTRKLLPLPPFLVPLRLPLTAPAR